MRAFASDAAERIKFCTAMLKLFPYGLTLLLIFVFSTGGWAQQSPDERPPVTRTIFIENALLVVRPEATPTLGNLLIRDGLLAAVGPQVKAPPEAKIIAADSLYVYAGFIDGLSHTAVPKPDKSEQPRYDGYPGTAPNAVAGILPERSVVEVMDATDKSVAALREAGFTAAHVVPRGNMLPGQGALLLLGESEDPVLRPATSLFAQFVGGRRVYPATDMAIMARFRELYKQSEQMKAHADRYAKKPRGMARPATDATLQAFTASIDQQRPIFFAVENVKEIHRALTLQKELGFPLALANVSDGFRALEALKAADSPLFLSLELPEAPKKKKTDKKDKTDAETTADADTTAAAARAAAMEARRAAAMTEYDSQAATLAAAGLSFGFSVGAVKPKEIQPNILRMITAGLSEEQALAALTTTPAALLGVADIMGTIEKGKMANLVVSDKPWFTEGANLRYVFVEGMPFEYEAKKQKKAGAANGDLKATSVGTWSITIDIPGQVTEGTLTISGAIGDLSGDLAADGESISLRNVEQDEDELTFEGSIEEDGQAIPLKFTLTISGDSLSGEVAVAAFGTFTVSGDRKDP